MKIQTNQGDVELTAEMVVKGMVFQSPEGAPYTLLRQIVEFDEWVSSDGSSEPTEYLLNETWRRFLGCDPAIAARADCERFGVHGDAAAHGFARLRGGGAVDFRRAPMPVGAVSRKDGKTRIVLPQTPAAERVLEEGEWFMGLARRACPEDIGRLCCGEYGPDQIDNGNRTTWAPQCTLAIGDHVMHEDLATGVRWGDPKPVPGTPSTCSMCLEAVTSPAPLRVILAEAPEHRGVLCDTCARWSLKDVEWHGDRLVPKIRAINGSDGGSRAPTCPCCEEAAKGGEPVCAAESPDKPHYGCTLRQNHKGREHIAHGDKPGEEFHVCARWPVEEKPEIAWSDWATPGYWFRSGSHSSGFRFEGDASGLRWDGADHVQRWARDPPRKKGCPECPAGEGEHCGGDCPRVVRYKATRCGAKPERGQVLVAAKGNDVLATGEETCDRERRERGSCSAGNHRCEVRDRVFEWGAPRFLSCPICATRIMPYGSYGAMCFAVYDPKEERVRSAPVCESCDKMHSGNVAALRWDGDRLVINTPSSERVAREASLVALVNACPEGLNPNGWRAAVLAVEESIAVRGIQGSSVLAFRYCDIPKRLQERVTGDTGYLSSGIVERSLIRTALAAYDRAIAPRVKMAPERKTRGPVIVVDDGRDE